MSYDAESILVSGVGKCFQIYERPSDRLKQFIVPRLTSFIGRQNRPYFREFWALRDIDFSIRKGETVGIIGRNGAGKSTLLQLICGTLSPSCGDIQVVGRIAALLELGAGFNPEFSGRDNVYLNARVLGLSKEEIDERFDEIARFADIGEFLEQPVKTYSSGMYVRLAFAVQACIEPDILIVDEALAVGDIGFQHKCFKRIESLKAKGVTILMVTHSSGSILEYADRCLVLEGGRIIIDTSDVLSAVMAYEKGMILSQHSTESVLASDQVSDEPFPTHESLQMRQMLEANSQLGERRFGSARAIIGSLGLARGDGTPLEEGSPIRSGDTVLLSFDLVASEEIDEVALGVSLSRAQGGDLWGDSNIAAGHPINLKAGRQTITYRVTWPINRGEYLLHCGLASLKGGDREELDQRRPMKRLTFWSSRELGGVVHAPLTVLS